MWDFVLEGVGAGYSIKHYPRVVRACVSYCLTQPAPPSTITTQVITGRTVYVPPNLAAQQEEFYARKAENQRNAQAAAAVAAPAAGAAAGDATAPATAPADAAVPTVTAAVVTVPAVVDAGGWVMWI